MSHPRQSPIVTTPPVVAQTPAAEPIATPVFGRPPPNGVWATPVGGHTDDGVVPHPALALATAAVPGLECADLPPTLAQHALLELKKANFGGSPAHQHLEIGLPFYATSTKSPIDKFPATKALITKAHEALRHAPPDWQNINVICRWYRKEAL